jgi:flagellar biosynthesis/type III secretory pathway M-ring protein FliF/YscJ
MAKKQDEEQQDENAREERLDKIKSLISGNSEDAAKVLKMWLTKDALEKNKK